MSRDAMGAQRLPEHRTTAWHNPLDKAQRVKLTEGEGRGLQEFWFTVGPGETKELDSRYDRAIHLVDCGKDECTRLGGRFCMRGHEGLIQGGLAPLLRRVGKNDSLDESIDPALAEKKILEEELTKLALVGQAKQNVALAAATRLQEMSEANQATAPRGAQAPAKK